MAKQSRTTLLKTWLGLKQAHELLESEVEGLYGEMDKLARKSPSESVTDLQLRAINSFISKSKQLLSDDVVIGEVTSFVAAGDNPEYRDAVTVLRQITQALKRYREHRWKYFWDSDFDDELLENELDEEDARPFFGNANH